MSDYATRKVNYTLAKRMSATYWVLGTAGVASVACIAGYMCNQQLSNLAVCIQPNDFTLTEEERRQFIDIASNADQCFTSNVLCNLDNLSLEQGLFILMSSEPDLYLV